MRQGWTDLVLKNKTYLELLERYFCQYMPLLHMNTVTTFRLYTIKRKQVFFFFFLGRAQALINWLQNGDLICQKVWNCYNCSLLIFFSLFFSYLRFLHHAKAMQSHMMQGITNLMQTRGGMFNQMQVLGDLTHLP